MKNLKVNAATTQVDVDTLIEQMINDIKEGDMDAIKHIAESMYPVIIEDVDGLEGEEIHVTVDFKEVPGANLEDIF